MSFLQKAQRAIADENVDGWLFFNFHNRDITACRLLEVRTDTINSRPWFCIIPASGEPIKIVHAIESGILDSLPGEKRVYATRDELTGHLKPLAGRYAAQVSESLPVISYLDHGTARYLEGLGFELVSSAGLIQKTVGILDEQGIASHRRAASLLYECIRRAWEGIQSDVRDGEKVSESMVQERIHDFFRANHLVSDHPILVAAGVHTADPHYDVPRQGAVIQPGDIVQFDIWAKEDTPGGIYADISWVAVLAEKADPEAEKLFRTVAEARDRAVSFISERLEQGSPVRGEEVDRLTRDYLTREGYGPFIRHRTGHGIDTDVHGSGVNLDAVEFPDGREIIEGSCFSVEPGIYHDRYGMRTEIDAYRLGNRLVISGGPVQQRILTL